MALASRIALVTGAASGLGRATAQRLLAQGARVALLDLPSSSGAEVVKGLGDRAIFVPTDVTQEDQVLDALDRVTQQLGKGLNVAVNCAGIAPPSKVLGRKGPHSLALFQKVVEVNLVGSFNVVRLAAERMSTNEPGESGERGVIVNTAR